jgi:hypothetical protein
LDNISLLRDQDKQLIRKVIELEMKAGDRMSIWDFADSLEKAIRAESGEIEHDRDSKQVLGDLIERFRRQQEGREHKLLLEHKRKQDAEERECTFKPSVTMNPFYRDVKSRFRHSPVRKSVSSQPTEPPQTEKFEASLRESKPTQSVKETEDERDVKLSPAVVARLNEASAFYEEYREQMAQLREYHMDVQRNPNRAYRLST